VAGSVALGFGETFFTAARAELELRSQIEFARGVRIVPAGLGGDGPVVGAAAVGWRAAGRSPLAL
jgi:glucokinase